MDVEPSVDFIVASFGAGRRTIENLPLADIAVFWSEQKVNGQDITHILTPSGKQYTVRSSVDYIFFKMRSAGIFMLDAERYSDGLPVSIVVSHANVFSEKDEAVLVYVLNAGSVKPQPQEQFFVLDTETGASLNAQEFGALKSRSTQVAKPEAALA